MLRSFRESGIIALANDAIEFDEFFHTFMSALFAPVVFFSAFLRRCRFLPGIGLPLEGKLSAKADG